MPPRQPIYQEIADTLRDEIVGGGYAVGDPFPKEFDLCDRFGVSRHTVRSALSRLEREGLLDRQKATGTLVRSTDPSSAFMQKLASVDDLLQYPVDTRLDAKFRKSIPADKTLAEWFDVAPGTRITRIGGLRSRIEDAMPLCWMELYVREEYAGVFEHVGKNTRPVYRIIEQLFDEKISRVEVEISAATITEPEAGYLAVEEGTPALKVLRRYFGKDGRVFETSVGLHPEDRFSYNLTFDNEPAT